VLHDLADGLFEFGLRLWAARPRAPPARLSRSPASDVSLLMNSPARSLRLLAVAAVLTVLTLPFFGSAATPPSSGGGCLVVGLSVPTAPVVCYVRP
jgi:hypothetical protein